MTGTRLVAFVAIGSLAALQWASLLAEPPTLRLLGVAAVATLLGWLLSRIAPGSGRRPWLTTAALAAAATAAAVLVLGAPAGDLMPTGWERLGAGVDEGLAGLGGAFDYPFGGSDEWSRLLLVIAIVPLTVAASVLSFRPGRDRDRAPVAGLVALIVAFSIPAIARPTAVPLLWGGVLLALVAVWLWGGRVRSVPALALIGGLGLAAVPVASGLAAGSPAVDYESWALPGAERTITFDWEPTYGPIQWPRSGRVLFRVHAERPSFWRVGVLDEFEADGWRRSGGGGPPAPAEPGPSAAPVYDPGRTRSAWFSIRALESPLLISPGTSLTLQGIDGSDRDRDGTTHLEEPLRAGSSYSVLAWAPDPDPARLRAASRRYRRPLVPYTRLALPDGADLRPIAEPTRVSVPLWGHDRGVERARRRLVRSAYGRVLRLAERLTAGAESGYAAATRIAAHLRSSYAYDESPPVRRLPLWSFLFRDRAGHCQHYAGAMALMLRMVGVPARVAVGFAPGTPTAAGRGYEVTDLDAHSWVEVYFNGIGWLPFDPTPPTAPASVETRGGASFGPDADGPDVELSVGVGARLAGRGHDASPPVDDGDDGPAAPPFGILAALVGALLVVPPIRSLRHRRLTPDAAGGREVAELRRVLRATGWAPTDSTTLLVVEERLHRARREAAAAYVRSFRERLYGGTGAPGPSLAERRSMRRDLGAGGRLGSRLRLLVLMPPGAPRGGTRA